MNALPRWTSGLVAIAALALALGGCKSEKEPAAQAPAQADVAAAPITQSSWAPDALEELVAPIALYPDLLVGQVLAASVNAQEVLDAGNWLLENQELSGDALDAAAQKLGFGEATRALLRFPTVIDMMCQEIDWTRQLGAAFTSDQKGVLDAVQRLRASAAQVGNLKDSPQQTVETRTEEGKTYVVIEPADPKVVYVPQYDPAVVYTTPPTTTVVESSSGVSTGGVLLAFGIGIAVGAAINNNYYPYPHWGYGAVYMGPRPFYPPAYAYRPVYGAGFRPAYGYRPPVNYHNSYNRNTNVNININNNYSDRFKGNANTKAGGARSPIAGKTSDRPKAGTSDWKGKSSYAGARPSNGKASTKGGTKAPRPANVDRGYGGSSGTRATASTRPSTSPGTRANAGAATPRAAATPSTPARSTAISGSGGYKHTVDANTGANVVSSTRSSGASSSSSASRGGDAFSRQGSGSFDRSASARGQASTSSASRGGGGRSGGGGGRR